MRLLNWPTKGGPWGEGCGAGAASAKTVETTARGVRDLEWPEAGGLGSDPRPGRRGPAVPGFRVGRPREFGRRAGGGNSLPQAAGAERRREGSVPTAFSQTGGVCPCLCISDHSGCRGHPAATVLDGEVGVRHIPLGCGCCCGCSGVFISGGGRSSNGGDEGGRG
jgi:hypothetical protein